MQVERECSKRKESRQGRHPLYDKQDGRQVDWMQQPDGGDPDGSERWAFAVGKARPQLLYENEDQNAIGQVDQQIDEFEGKRGGAKKMQIQRKAGHADRAAKRAGQAVCAGGEQAGKGAVKKAERRVEQDVGLVVEQEIARKAGVVRESGSGNQRQQVKKWLAEQCGSQCISSLLGRSALAGEGVAEIGADVLPYGAGSRSSESLVGSGKTKRASHTAVERSLYCCPADWRETNGSLKACICRRCCLCKSIERPLLHRQRRSI